MNVLAWLWVAPLAVILASGGVLAVAYRPAESASAHRLGPRRGNGLVARLAPAFGRICGCVLVLAAGTGVIIAVCWPVGYAARNFDNPDHAVYRWVARHQTHWLQSAMRLLTEMSNNRQSQVVGGAAMVILTVVWLRHRRGLAVLTPAVLVITAYEIEHQLQHTLKLLAHRTGHNPVGLGSFPSGGVARLMSIYGLIIYLVLRRFGKTRSKAAVVAWTLLAAATFTEAYSRLYLGKHWISDIFGGLVFGAILLAVLIAATQMLDRPNAEDEAAVSGDAAHRTVADVGSALAPGRAERQPVRS